MRTRVLVTLAVTFMTWLWAAGLRAQDIVDEALQDFPTQTQHLEYSNSAKLRELPSYNKLKQRYLGSQLQKLEKSLATVGIEDADVDELVLGWQSVGGAKSLDDWDLYGVAAGRFNGDDISRQAAAQGVKPTPVGSLKVYCLGPDRPVTCLVMLDDALGAFGTLKQLSAMLAARGGQSQGLSSVTSFANLVNETKSDAPIWGVAEGSAVADWLRSSMPAQDSSMQLDWSQAFSDVDALAYTINVADKAHLGMKLECKSPGAAANLQQVLNGLRAFEQMAWQNKNPSLPNPFENVQVKSAGKRVELDLDTPVPGA